MIQEANKHKNIHHRIPSGSPILGEMSSVCRYQKYCVSDDLSHSVSRSVEVNDEPTLVKLVARLLVVTGHSAHGSVPYYVVILKLYTMWEIIWKRVI